MNGPFEVPHGHRRGSCCGMGHTPAPIDPGGNGHFRHYRRPEGCCGSFFAVLAVFIALVAVLL